MKKVSRGQKNNTNIIHNLIKKRFKGKMAVAISAGLALFAVSVMLSVSFVGAGYIKGNILNSYAANSEEEIKNSQDRINENKQKIEELNSQKNDIEQMLENLNALKSDAAAYIEQLDKELGEIEQKISELEVQIAETEAQIAITAEELDAAIENEEKQYESMKLRIKFMYENGQQNAINMLLDSGSLSDMLNRAEYISNITEYDRNKLDEYINIKLEIEAKEAQLNSEKELLDETNSMLQEEKENIEKLQEDKNNEIASYNAQIAGAEADIASMDADIAGIQQAIEAEENNIAAIEAQIKAEEEAKKKAAEESGETYDTTSVGDITFTWPCPSSSNITSYFGDRDSPMEGASSDHKGVDISASTGDKVIAAASGTVVIATYSTSAGNYVMLNHGGGVYTVYMHMSSIAVSVGDSVSMGDTVGAVGSTGYSTGPHLHFGLRINGSYTNPLSYVSP